MIHNKFFYFKIIALAQSNTEQDCQMILLISSFTRIRCYHDEDN